MSIRQATSKVLSCTLCKLIDAAVKKKMRRGLEQSSVVEQALRLCEALESMLSTKAKQTNQ